MCLAVGLSVCAQTTDGGAKSITTYSFGNSWTVSAGGGLSMLFSDHDGNAAVGDRLAPAFELSIGKWFSPHFGMRVAMGGGTAKGLTQTFDGDESYSTGETHPDNGGWGQWLEYQKFNYLNAHLDLMFNARTILMGNQPGKFWDPIPYIGAGMAFVTTDPAGSAFSFNAGFLNSFNLSEALSVYLDLRGMAALDAFDGTVGGRPLDGMFSASVGVTYKF